MVAFAHASQALSCALELQRRPGAPQPGRRGCELRVRIALHSGEALLRDPRNYVGPALNRCARLRAAAHGGQTLLSRATYELVADRLPEGAGLRSLGPQRLQRPDPRRGALRAHPPRASDRLSAPALARRAAQQPAGRSSRASSAASAELAEVGRLLADHRLVTLTGAGGCGKTRLALQAASETLDRFPDGAWWVELAPLAEERLVGAAIAEALGVRPLPGMTELQAAGAYLAPRRALLVLDNCEHLAEACAEAAESLLGAAPEVVVLATSRAPLGVGGETEWRVPSLSLPADEERGPGRLRRGGAVHRARRRRPPGPRAGPG